MKTDETLEQKQNDLKGGENLNKKKSFGGKLKGALKGIALIALSAVLLAMGGIGILLGIVALLVAVRKPILKLTKKAYKNIADKMRQRKDDSKMQKRAKTSSLEMDAASLKQLKTRSDSVSKIDIIPVERAKSTSNESQKNNLKFDGLTKPIIKLSESAVKLRRSNSSLARSKSLPNLKNVRPSM
ncbi:hypothetical protein [Flavobacterium poyangense]|uniref:hypothetical protein n=1 Tax=Flavobacterium poyangense TaxID=2204302 RepID=UPI00142047F5|nr:hypothetical protein [Flavobacterium sp. JXAS1]